jgi:Phage integrase family
LGAEVPGSSQLLPIRDQQGVCEELSVANKSAVIAASVRPIHLFDRGTRRLLKATDVLEVPESPLQALTVRTLLLLLYGTAMRIGEALSLTLHDVDLAKAENQLPVRPLHCRIQLVRQNGLMKSASGCLSNYQICAVAANHDSPQSSVGNCTKEAFLVGERNLFEFCAVALWAP